MMRSIALLSLVVLAAPLAAQDPALAPRRQALEAQIVERFMANYRQQAGLSDEQFTRFRSVAQRAFRQRRERQRREMEVWRALEGQMRPGVAANPDSLGRLLEGILALRQGVVEQARADDREFATFLTPVQRAQLFLSLERFQRSVENVQQRIRQGAGAAPPGQVPEP
jgi:hypothetical protein